MISRERNNAKAIILPIIDTMAHICLDKVNRYKSFVSDTLLFNENNDNVRPKIFHTLFYESFLVQILSFIG